MSNKPKDAFHSEERDPKVERRYDHGNGVTEEWIYDGKIVVFTITDDARLTIDTWYKAVLAVATGFKGTRLCILHDYSAVKAIAPSPYLRSRAEELSKLRSDIQVFIAVVLPNSFLAGVLEVLMRRRNRNELSLNMVATRQKAINWLKTKAQL